jgi:acyl carrier protein
MTMIAKAEILKQVQQLLTEAFELEESAVTLEAHLYRDLDLDSFDAIDLAVNMESKTGIKLQEEELKFIRTVSDIVEVVYPKVNPSS